MKRTLLLSGAFAAMLSVAACGEKNEVVEDGPVENASAESGVGSNPVSNAAQDATSAAVGAVSAATLGRTTEGFVTNAAIANMYEIAASRLALEKAQNPQVKAYAQKIINDHEKTMKDMQAAVGSAAGVTPPTAMDERRQGMVDNLRQAPAGQFDGVYVAQQIAAHGEDVTLHRTYADAGDNAALKQIAARHLPILEGHLQSARTLEQAVGGQGAQGGQAGAQGGSNAGGAQR